MLFYRALDTDGKLQIRGTQGEITKINKDFDTWEFPTAKAEIMEVLQDLVDRAEGATTAPQPVEEPKPTNPHAACPKCRQTAKGAAVLADIRVDEIVCGKLEELPDRTILRVMDNIMCRVLEIARKADLILKGQSDAA